MDWYLNVLQNHYFDFEGRARRKEFWMFALINFAISIVITIVVGVVSDSLASIVSMLYSLAVMLPSIGLGVRRLHDTGRTGWLALLALIPLVNLVLIYFFVLEGDAGPNEYGPDPKGGFDDMPGSGDLF
ncbi:hypothetical protein B1759_12690 [Rubrivirga sp. SAORIC476]|uniref:DUF805 domain-containing protein n=1 Tax=Rubrivirga sp. SAORIC476 TaxID=1961794 RepID=UPI000BA97EAE|nr:DUF805 domain-containing protein [Rubrivirga sp. SAORIC476]MAQ92783.1 DUF805 domain-containing protein [Rhodothermaceae bacterium]MAS53029.1 DUF805 domain-containing protein [Pimelobacter sp.]MBC14143.1 DUF805 domain-containing protein [Rhodothermaceae bacterium]PAP79205.1 hypothetical protein B1759_12690 [Rubrivirga sp. SAORIC476]